MGRNVRLPSTGAIIAAISLAFVLIAGCGGESRVGEFYTRWDESGACTSGDTSPWGRSAAGVDLSPCDFSGSFVWVNYTALWCSASLNQALEFNQLARRGRENAVFITVLTGGRKVATPATAADAGEWAERFGLDKQRVVSEGESYRTIPQHLLIGPDGRTWFRYVGFLGHEEILALLEDFQQGRRPGKSFRSSVHPP